MPKIVQRLAYLMCGLMLGIVSAHSSEAATYHVSTTGNDANTCAQAQNSSTPKRTPSNAMSCLASGDTLYLRQGTYTVHSSIANSIPSGGGSWTTATKIASYPGETATLTSADPVNMQVLYFDSERSYIILERLRLSGGLDGLKIDKAHHIRFIGGEITNTRNQGILVGGPGFNEFVDCHIHQNGSGEYIGRGYEHGIYLTSPNYHLIENCTIANNRFGYAIQVFDHPAAGTVIRNNRIYGNYWGITLGQASRLQFYNNLLWGNGGGIHHAGGDNIIANNTVYSNTGDYPCIWVRGSSSGGKIENNICYGNQAGYQSAAILIDNWGGDTPSGVTVRNNLVSNNSHDAIVDYGISSKVSGNFVGRQYDPSFVNAVESDLRLNTGSVAIDKGVTVNEVSTDYAGAPRPQGCCYDIGAFEFRTGIIETSPLAPTNLVVVVP